MIAADTEQRAARRWPSPPPARPPADLRRRRAGVTVAATKSSDVDVVTESDRERGADPGCSSTLAPTTGSWGRRADEPGTSGVRWIVDPIDGTVNFLYGIPQYAVSIAA